MYTITVTMYTVNVTMYTVTPCNDNRKVTYKQQQVLAAQNALASQRPCFPHGNVHCQISQYLENFSKIFSYDCQSVKQISVSSIGPNPGLINTAAYKNLGSFRKGLPQQI